MEKVSEKFPKLVIIDDHKNDDWLFKSKGWCGHHLVELTNGDRYHICFFDNVRLGQELKNNAKDGQPFFIENNLIVLSEVTIENMQKALMKAEKQGFFENLKPINK